MVQDAPVGQQQDVVEAGDGVGFGGQQGGKHSNVERVGRRAQGGGQGQGGRRVEPCGGRVQAEDAGGADEEL